MDLNRIPNSANLARLRYEATRQDTQADSEDRIRSARAALARLSQVRAQRLREGRSRVSESHIAVTRQTSHHAPDQIEISDRARVMAQEHDAAAVPHNEEARAEKVAELKARHGEGRLNTPEAIDRAATRILEQDSQN